MDHCGDLTKEGTRPEELWMKPTKLVFEATESGLQYCYIDLDCEQSKW